MEHRSLHVVFLLIAFAWLSTAVQAQSDTQYISLDKALQAAIANNRNIRLAELDGKIAEANYKQTQAIFLPQVGFSYTAMSTDNPLNVFGYKLQQQSIKQSDFNPDLLNNPSSASDVMTKVDVRQPLVNVDMWFMRKGAAKQIELYQLKTQRTNEYIQFEVKKALLQLQLAYRGKGVLDEALFTAQELFAFISNRVEQGLLQQSDALNEQVQIKTIESNLAEAKSNIRNASDYISYLMGVPYGAIYKPDKTTEPFTTTAAIVTAVPTSRADFSATNKAIEAQELMIRSQKLAYLPRLNAFGSYQFNDKTLTGFGSNAYLAGIQLSWDLFDGNKRKNVIATKRLEKQKLEEQLSEQQIQSQLELNKTLRQLDDARFKIQQQQLAVTHATDALRILKNRHEQGLVNTTDVLMAQTQLSQQQLALAQAEFNYNLTYAYQQFLTSSSNKL